MRKLSALLLTLSLLALPFLVGAADNAHNALRGSVPLNEEGKPAPMFTVENKDIKRPRAYSM